MRMNQALSELANSFVSTFVKKTKNAVESFSADSLVDDLKNRTKGMSFSEKNRDTCGVWWTTNRTFGNN